VPAVSISWPGLNFAARAGRSALIIAHELNAVEKVTKRGFASTARRRQFAAEGIADEVLAKPGVRRKRCTKGKVTPVSTRRRGPHDLDQGP
jgi:hypothetical protein